MVTEKQLANLKPFTEKTARICGANGGKKKKENELKRLARQEAKERIIQEAYGQILDRLEKGKLSNSELISVFKSAIDISGDKTEKQEIELPDSLNINVITERD